MYTSMHMAQWAARLCLASGSNRPARAQVNSGFFYSNAEQREQLVAAERAVTDDRVRRVIQLKQEVRAAWVDTGARCALRHGVSGSDSGCVAPAWFWGDGRKATFGCLKLLSAAALPAQHQASPSPLSPAGWGADGQVQHGNVAPLPAVMQKSAASWAVLGGLRGLFPAMPQH